MKWDGEIILIAVILPSQVLKVTTEKGSVRIADSHTGKIKVNFLGYFTDSEQLMLDHKLHPLSCGPIPVRASSLDLTRNCKGMNRKDESFERVSVLVLYDADFFCLLWGLLFHADHKDDRGCNSLIRYRRNCFQKNLDWLLVGRHKYQVLYLLAKL
jgi:hypothetical protein